MKIDYKITTWVLLTILISSFFWCWHSTSRYNHMKGGYGMMTGSNLNGTHRMPDGTMMHNTSTSMSGMMMDMTAGMKGKSGKDLEKAFLVEMIPHHQGAIDMANLLLEDKALDPKLATFAKDIITAQQAEITQMKAWLTNYK